MGKGKRFLAVVFAVGCLWLTGCGTEEEPIKVESSTSSASSASSSTAQVFTCVGTWEITAAKQNDIGVSLEKVLEELGGNIRLTLYKDGSVYGRILNASMDGTWAQNGRKITVYISNGEEILLTTEGETLVMEQGDRKLIFSKVEE